MKLSYKKLGIIHEPITYWGTDEKTNVENLKKSSVIFGATVLKRIVPGWFIRADLGNDILSGGLTLEF